MWYNVHLQTSTLKIIQASIAPVDYRMSAIVV